MRYLVENSLSDFEFWLGGADTAADLTTEQLDRLEELLEEYWSGDPPTEMDINDFFWFERDTIAEWLEIRVSDDGSWISDDEVDKWAQDVIEKVHSESMSMFWEDFFKETDMEDFKNDSQVAEAYEEWVEEHYAERAKSAIMEEFPDADEELVEQFILDEWDALDTTEEDNLECFGEWCEEHKLFKDEEDGN